MADQTATFAIELQDQGSAGADSLEDSLVKLKQRIAEDTAALKEMQNAMRQLKGSSSTDVEAFRNLRNQIDAKKASVASARAEFVKLGGSFDVAKDKSGGAAGGAAEAGAQIQNLLGVAQSAGGPLGQLAGQAGQLKALLGKGGAAGAVVALVAVVVLLGAAVVTAYIGLARFALGAADAARSTRLLLQAATGSAAAGGVLEGQIDTLAGKVATARGELEQTALSMARLGLGGLALQSAFASVATTSAVMGQAAGSTLQGLAERAKLAKRFVAGALDFQGTGLKLDDVAAALSKRMNVSFATAKASITNGRVTVTSGLEALNDAVQAKFGKIAKAQLLELPVQAQKAKENLAGLFTGVKIEPFLEALHDVLSIFDKNTITGRALKVVVETMLAPLFGQASTLGPIVKALFQGMVIGALIFAIALLSVRKAWREAFGGDTKSTVDWVSVAMYAGVVAFGLMAGAAITLAVAFGLVAVSLLFAFSPLILLVVLVGALVAGLTFAAMAIIGAFSTAVAYLRKLDFGEIAANLVDGLVNGITAGAGRVADSVKNLGQGAMSALKSVLGIASPSKVFAKYGRFTAEGFAQGVESGAGKAQTAVEGMVTPPLAAPPRGARSGQGGDTYYLEVNGVKDADQMTSRSFLEQLVEQLRGAKDAAGISSAGPEMA